MIFILKEKFVIIFNKFKDLVTYWQNANAIYKNEWPGLWGGGCCWRGGGGWHNSTFWFDTYFKEACLPVFLNREKNCRRQKREQILLLWVTCSSYFKHFWSVLRSIWYCLNLVPCRLSPIWIEKPCRYEDP